MSAPIPVEPPPTPSDVLLGRVILVLGFLAVLSLGMIGLLAYHDRPTPDALVFAAGSAVTGLASILTGRRT